MTPLVADGADDRGRAQADTGEHPREIAERIYNDEFLSELGKQFEFDALEEQTAIRLREMAVRYIIGRRMEIPPDVRKRARVGYLELQKATKRCLELLKQHEKHDIASDMFLAALQLQIGDAKPRTNAPDLAEDQTESENAYYRELLWLLELLRKAAANQARGLASRGGRPKNLGLKYLTWLAAGFWVGELEKPFTLDYHGGAGLSPAFDFVKALIAPIDAVKDKQIITVMRTEIALRNRA
jgi:hypothetical protein